MMVYDVRESEVRDNANLESGSTIAKLITVIRHAYNCAYIWLTNLCYAAGRFL